ncbi:DUF262 domain-containing protein [Clostridium estertheticum]|uniref:DUF262 domain-containing protein n=2 Tax=Clostridium estertheticum TaxID=238834 RepID=UPI0027155E1B|nr:DUF262 domain-containing protein [Clostridium estertheticum]
MMNEIVEEKIKPQKINIAQVTFSVFETIRKVERGDILLGATFQRNAKWKFDKKSRLIESIILDIPIQAIYLSEENENKYEIIDGQQRIRTITEFVSNKFKLESTSFCKENTYFKDLEPSIQRKIEDFQIVIFVVKKENHPDVKFEIFERINTGAVKLNSQELRNCVYRNRGIPFIKELANEELFKIVIKNKHVSITSMQDQELVLRFMSFYYKGVGEYTGNLKKFLNDTLENYEQYRNRESEFKKVFIDTMNSIYNVFGDDAFIIRTRKSRGKDKINIALFEILTFSFEGKSSVELIKSKEAIKDQLLFLITNNQTFKEAITSASTTTKGKTHERFRIWQESLEEILGGM